VPDLALQAEMALTFLCKNAFLVAPGVPPVLSQLKLAANDANTKGS
jgi:hypothetical protein